MNAEIAVEILPGLSIIKTKNVIFKFNNLANKLVIVTKRDRLESRGRQWPLVWLVALW